VLYRWGNQSHDQRRASLVCKQAVSAEILVPIAFGVIGLELLCTLLVTWTFSRHRAILRRHLGHRVLEDLDAAENETIRRAVATEYERTLYRKVDLLVIAFHLPALASWVAATRQRTTPRVYYHLVTVAFWLVLSFGVAKGIALLRGA
jgi:hypothetical protein